jgi:type-2 restriction enzyme accI
MQYKDRIQKLTMNVDADLADFNSERVRASMPTQISSEFLTNKEQGDWAENTLLNGINDNSTELIAVHYGKNNNINAGDDGFKEFFEAYQDELDTIGKRPDILIFDKKDFPYETNDISGFSNEILDSLVPKAKCGIEVRSSAFLIDKYESYMNDKVASTIDSAMKSRNIILNNYKELLLSKDEALYEIVDSISPNNIHVISFRSPSWRSSKELTELSNELKRLKTSVNEISKRTFLSITPKVEDLKVVYTWVQKYNVPHYYIQVFFDKAYGISFEKILTIIGDPSLEGKEYYIESDVKNQGKTTIKINATNERNILEKIYLPEHYSEMKELNRGRLLFYVKFKDSISVINKDEFEKLLGIKLV